MTAPAALATGKDLTALSDRFSSDVTNLTEEVYGAEAVNVLRSLTEPVRTYYVRCNTIKTSPDQLKRSLEGRGLRVSQHPEIPEALGIQIEGPFDISTAGKQMIVDKHTAESVMQGANVYAPGVVKCQSIRFRDDVTVVSELGDVLATGKALMNTNEILTFRKGLAVDIEHRRYNAPQVRELPEYAHGLLYPQSLAAMVTSHVLDPQNDETVLDMNCAPGGKISHLSQLMRNSGRILGLDRNAEKISSTRKTIAMLGCSNATVSIHDSRYVDVDFAALKPDRVLIDPPCSALGLRPKVYDLTTKKRVNNLADYQKQFIKSASRVVKPEGVIVYSVCTYTIQECEEVVAFAEEECGLHSVEQKPFLTIKTNGETVLQRFHPARDEIGYFIAKFQR